MPELILIAATVGGFVLFCVTEPHRERKRREQRIQEIRLHLNVMHVLKNPDRNFSRMLAKTPDVKQELERLANQ